MRVLLLLLLLLQLFAQSNTLLLQHKNGLHIMRLAPDISSWPTTALLVPCFARARYCQRCIGRPPGVVALRVTGTYSTHHTVYMPLCRVIQNVLDFAMSYL
jgi:hypothetical protein